MIANYWGAKGGTFALCKVQGKTIPEKKAAFLRSLLGEGTLFPRWAFKLCRKEWAEGRMEELQACC